MDISDKDGSFGVAVLNDCKYGYDAKEKLMRLTLIKSGIFPNPNADQGLHEFTYSLFPHEGDYREGRVIEEARKLNENNHFYIPESKSSLSGQPFDIVAAALKGVIDIEERGVFVEAVKMAENSKDIVIRLFEGYGEKHTVKASLFNGYAISPKAVSECDLLERKTEVHDGFGYDAQNKLLSFEIEPFEIKTFVLSVS